MTDLFYEKRRDMFLKDPFDSELFDAVAHRTRFILRYCGLEFHGLQILERVLRQPCLFVVNHSAAFAVDVMVIAHLFHRAVIAEHVRGLAHRIAWHPPLSAFQLRKFGAIYAHPEVAEHFVHEGKSLVVFPGGDKEAFRTFDKRYKVDLAGRTGFIRLAKRLSLPIIPITICGTHAMYLQLVQSRILSRLGRQFIRADNISLNASQLALMAAVLNPLMWPLLPALALKNIVPLPSKVRIDVGDVIEHSELTKLPDTDAYLHVQSRMQVMLTRASEERVCPWF